MAAAVAACPSLEDPTAVQSLVKGIRAEMMVAMLEGLQGTAAACTEICLRRLEAQRRELWRGCGAEEALSDSLAVGAEGPASADRPEHFLIDADDGGVTVFPQAVEQGRASERRREAAGEERAVAAAVADLDAWYAEASPGRADLGVEGASSSPCRDGARRTPEPLEVVESVAPVASEVAAPTAEERRPESCAEAAEPQLQASEAESAFASAEAAPPEPLEGPQSEEDLLAVAGLGSGALEQLADLLEDGGVLGQDEQPEGPEEASQNSELRAAPEPSPPVVALGSGDFEALAEFMEDEQPEGPEDASPDPELRAAPEASPPDVALGSGDFEALAEFMEERRGDEQPEEPEDASQDPELRAAPEPSPPDVALGSGDFEALAEFMEDELPEGAEDTSPDPEHRAAPEESSPPDAALGSGDFEALAEFMEDEQPEGPEDTSPDPEHRAAPEESSPPDAALGSGDFEALAELMEDEQPEGPEDTSPDPEHRAAPEPSPPDVALGSGDLEAPAGFMEDAPLEQAAGEAAPLDEPSEPSRPEEEEELRLGAAPELPPPAAGLGSGGREHFHGLLEDGGPGLFNPEHRAAAEPSPPDAALGSGDLEAPAELMDDVPLKQAAGEAALLDEPAEASRPEEEEEDEQREEPKDASPDPELGAAPEPLLPEVTLGSGDFEALAELMEDLDGCRATREEAEAKLEVEVEDLDGTGATREEAEPTLEVEVEDIPESEAAREEEEAGFEAEREDEQPEEPKDASPDPDLGAAPEPLPPDVALGSGDFEALAELMQDEQHEQHEEPEDAARPAQDLGAAREPVPPDVALGSGDLEALAELMEDEQPEKPEDASPDPELGAAPGPLPQEVALGSGDFEALAELMEERREDEQPEEPEDASPDPEFGAAPGPLPPEAAPGSGDFEALAELMEGARLEQAELESAVGAPAPEQPGDAHLDAGPSGTREPLPEFAPGSGAFGDLADALDAGGPEQALPDAPEDDLDFVTCWGLPAPVVPDRPAPGSEDRPAPGSDGESELEGAEPAACVVAEDCVGLDTSASTVAPDEAAVGDGGGLVEGMLLDGAFLQCIPCQVGSGIQGLLPDNLLLRCPASGGYPSDGPSPRSQGGSTAESGKGKEEPRGPLEPGAGGGGPGEGPGGEGGGDAPAGGGASVEAQTSSPVSLEPVMDVIVPDGCTYRGEKIPEGCTVAQWKSGLEAGVGGAKVLYARKLLCHADRQKRKPLSDDSVLPLRPEVVVVSGPGAVTQMLELALRKRLGNPLPPPIVAAEGRAFACATASCRFMVHSDPGCGNYCCNMCLENDGRGHSEDCELRQAPRHAPKGKPQAKYRAMSLSTDDLLKKEATFKPVTGEAKSRTFDIVKARGNYLGPYCDGETMSGDDVRKRLAMHSTEHGWTLDYNVNFYAELLYEGVFPMGFELPGGDKGPIQALLFCYDPKVSVWDFHETHISRQVRKHAKSYSMTIDKAYDDVILGCVRQHGEAWLYRGYRWMLRKIFKEGYQGTKMKFGVHSFELWDEKNQLVAGDLGCTIGGVYMSFSGFRMKDTKSCGEVQMVLTAGLLSRMGFDWMDLGQVLKYKERMGAKVITRKEYYARLRRDRDKSTDFLHDRISGQELLATILQAVADGPKPMPTGDHDEFAVVYNKVAMREKPSLEAHILGIWHRDAELEGTPHEVGGVPWLKTEDGWVLMDGKTLGLGQLVAPRYNRVAYGKATGDAAAEADQQKDEEQPAEAAEEAPAPAEPAAEDQEPPTAEGQEKDGKDKDGEKKEKEGEKKENDGDKKAKDPKKGSETQEEKRKKKAEKEATARKQAAERVARLEAKEEKAAKYRQEEEEAVERALERRRNPELFKPKSLKEKKKWRREEELLQKREEAERAKERAAEEEAARLQAIEDMKQKRAEEAEEKKRKAEEQAALKKIADQEALKKKADDEAIVRAMISAATEGAAPLPNQPKMLPKAKLKALAAKCVPTMDDQDLEDDGRLWVVTGGEGKGGIMVRAAESINSRQLPSRLLTGSTVEELEIAGNRLHYKRIRGDGPDWGWVSIMLSGKLLVEPFPT